MSLRFAKAPWVKSFAKALSAASCLSFALGCDATETGNPTRVLIAALSSKPDEVAITPATGPIRVDSLWHAVARVWYIPCDGEVIDLVETATPIDFVSGAGAAVIKELPEGTYCYVGMEFTPLAPNAEVPNQLATYTFFMTGELETGPGFEVVAAGFRLETALSAPLDRTAGGRRAESVAPDGDGVIRLDRSMGEPLGFQTLWRSAMGLHEDINDNGRVDPDEPNLFVPLN